MRWTERLHMMIILFETAETATVMEAPRRHVDVSLPAEWPHQRGPDVPERCCWACRTAALSQKVRSQWRADWALRTALRHSPFPGSPRPPPAVADADPNPAEDSLTRRSAGTDVITVSMNADMQDEGIQDWLPSVGWRCCCSLRRYSALFRACHEEKLFLS